MRELLQRRISGFGLRISERSGSAATKHPLQLLLPLQVQRVHQLNCRVVLPAPLLRLSRASDLILPDSFLERELSSLRVGHGQERFPVAAELALKTPDQAWIMPSQQPHRGGDVARSSFNQKIGNLR